MQAAAPKGLVSWPFGLLDLEKVDGCEEAEEADEAREDKETP